MEKTIGVRPLIEADGVTKRYDGFTLNVVSLTVEPGQAVGFIGQNGAGKSTTIKALLGLIGIDGGEARVLGVPARDLRGAFSSVKEDIGVVFDTVSMPPHLKIGEVEKLMAAAYAAWDASAFDRYLDLFGLDRSKEVKGLSRGMGMKLSLACALSHDPRVLILDEATAGLDPMAREEVLDLLREFVAVEDDAGNPCHGILMSSHITSDLERIADEVVCIDEGRVVFALASEFVAVEDDAGNPCHGILMSSHITSDLERIADEVVCIDEGRVVFALAKDEICDAMGIARCRAADVDALASSALAGSGLRALRNEYGVDVLVPDRFAFASAFPQIPCDRTTIDDYMMLMLKGEVLPRGGSESRGGER